MKLRPSNAHRWQPCPGSVNLSALYPDVEGQDAREGTASHWAAAEMLHHRMVAPGQITPAGVVLSEEMIEAAEVYARDVQFMRGTHTLYVEQFLPFPSISPDCGGTPDAWLAKPGPRDTLYVIVWDYKYGHGFVEVFDNWQLIAYAAGIIDALTAVGWMDQQIHFDLRIVQPRSYHRSGPIRSWRVPATDLRGPINRLAMSAEIALLPDAETWPGPHCEHCPGRHACDALQRAALRVADIAGTSIPFELPPAALGLELLTLDRASKMLEARREALQEQVYAALKAGQRVPHWSLQPQPGREAWTVDPASVAAIGQHYGVQMVKPDALITPNQARAAGLPVDVVAQLAARPAPALKLAPDTGSDARRVFQPQAME